MGEGTEYKAIYRRTEVALPGLVGAILFMGLGIYLSLQDGSVDRAFEKALWVIGITVAAVLLIFANSFRVHSWTILADGLRIHQRPKVPLMGLSQNVTVPFDEISGLLHVESGFDYVVDLITRGGRRFRLSQAMKPGERGIARPDHERSLASFVAAIVETARSAGRPLAEPRQGLSLWNLWPGLALQLIMFAITLAFALAAGWALLEGGLSPTSGRTGYGVGIVMALPFGAAYLLLKSLKRRRLVLSQLSHRADPLGASLG